ncbi:MAG TPA: hypothetical protein VGM39_17505 [Kofleriaceae bacterium]|jgi:hypothetical protein
MRTLLLGATLLACSVAHADIGVYFADGFGGAAYRGQLSHYSDGDIRMMMGLGIRRDNDVLFISGAMNGGLFEYDCYGTECDSELSAEFGTFSVDFRKRIPLLYMNRLFSEGTYEHPVLSLELGGGPRWNWGDFGSSSGVVYGNGPGLGVNATLSADLWVIGYYLQAGLDVQHFDLDDGRTVRGSTPYILFGAKAGWM